MEYSETVACLVCRKPSNGYIGIGHVKRGREEVLTTFCSDECLDDEPAYDEDGCYGAWEPWMGQRSSE